ncbi:MAG TPA: hypothetical protein VFH00_11795 [Candidatus Nitrosotalea sp.]|nr:hypothetical protein [Candidatus Nitrosotalea sp.]
MEPTTFTLADLKDAVWTPEQEREFDEQEARQEAYLATEYGADPDEPPEHEPSKAERIIARAEDRHAYITERRAEIAQHDVEIDRLTEALKLIEVTEDEQIILARGELLARLDQHRKARNWAEYKLGGEARDTLYRAKQKVAKRTTVKPKAAPVKHRRAPNPGKWVRGTHYTSKPRERAEDWYYRKSPAAVLILVEEKRLLPVDAMYAGIIARHLETHQRSKGVNPRRITCEELAAKASRERKSAQRSVSRMVSEGALIVLDSGRGTHHGALYTFPARAS